MEQAIKAKPKLPRKIAVGRGLMMTGCVLFFINAFFSTAVFLGAALYKLYPEFILESIGPEFDALWSDPVSAIKICLNPVIAIFLIFAGIGGISWIRDKGPFISAAPLMAMISLILIIANLFVDVRALVMSNWNWGQFVLNLIDLQLTCGIYFIGWAMAKNQID